ncbi:hypothetical protein ElyMa_001347800 [Elysia marginata]|uniref:LITAF domain-containing protein n=1 Tax=Elysia marginata TaxID=1093978 RepID=A0AAV4ISH0_9GAST|nr:hypothetical protein ElyMa_001347800 [Elysia marginata]
MDCEGTSQTKEIATDQAPRVLKVTEDGPDGHLPSSESDSEVSIQGDASCNLIEVIDRTAQAQAQSIQLPKITSQPPDFAKKEPNPAAEERFQDGQTIGNTDKFFEGADHHEAKSMPSLKRRSSSQYGTFEEKLIHEAKSISVVSTDSDSKSYKEAQHSWTSEAVTVTESSSTSKHSVLVVVRDPTERTELFSRAELDHLCYDPHEQVKFTPDGGHWWKVIASTVVCPACGLISMVYACKSRYRFRKGSPVSAQDMLRHSDFCFRFAIVCGILLWASAFMITVVCDFDFKFKR